MPFRNWRVIAAVVGLAVATVFIWLALQPRPPDIPAYQGLQTQDAQYRPGGAKCDPANLGIPRREASDKAADCNDAAEQHRLQGNDLVQQTRAAGAAEQMALLAFTQTRIMVAQTIAGVFTLMAALFAAWYAREAARESKRGADAAIRSANHAEVALRVSRDMGHMQLRAYVHAKDAEVYTAVGNPYVVLTCVNTGETPAKFFRVSCAAILVPRAEAKFPTIPAGLSYGTWTGLGGNDETTVALHPDGLEQRTRELRAEARSQDKDSVLLIMGSIVYGDVIGHVAETEYAFFTPHITRNPQKLSRTIGKLRAYHDIEDG